MAHPGWNFAMANKKSTKSESATETQNTTPGHPSHVIEWEVNVLPNRYAIGKKDPSPGSKRMDLYPLLLFPNDSIENSPTPPAEKSNLQSSKKDAKHTKSSNFISSARDAEIFSLPRERDREKEHNSLFSFFPTITMEQNKQCIRKRGPLPSPSPFRVILEFLFIECFCRFENL
ncbi:hypothetical protein TNIN_460911 [Trichonephila inaurata madagascariensis]|uniref:Uncharacterized protein n=1 Tax=Trichonephila inaurata madagascariensis TaxID=2747483 RepID=A0A8X6WSP6_9ARAC|nr:hypothetical protein TNIN_460911 [Trichonephila inaurata madagascariensis]